jgi:hypothetical protein
VLLRHVKPREADLPIDPRGAKIDPVHAGCFAREGERINRGGATGVRRVDEQREQARLLNLGLQVEQACAPSTLGINADPGACRRVCVGNDEIGDVARVIPRRLHQEMRIDQAVERGHEPPPLGTQLNRASLDTCLQGRIEFADLLLRPLQPRNVERYASHGSRTTIRAGVGPTHGRDPAL